MKIIHLLNKEVRLLIRDVHGLALLFLMPLLFILIMSLAMQDTFSQHSSVKIQYLIRNADDGASSRVIEDALKKDSFLSEENSNDRLFSGKDLTVDQMKRAVNTDQVQFLVEIPEGFSLSLQSEPLVPEPISIIVAPGTQTATRLLFESRLRELIGKAYLDHVTSSFDFVAEVQSIDIAPLESALITVASNNDKKLPSSVQQNVPAWLVFSMFFIAIPVSTTLLAERRHGTLARQISMGVSRLEILLGKMFPFMLVNLLQVALMLAVGVWLVPALGGEALGLGQSPIALLLLSLAISFCAVSFALLIANIASTTDQATVMAGLFNILLAAIGGVMVPRFIMPPAMQSISLMSPHAWGLEGFLDVILRNGGIVEVLPEVLKLLVLGLVLFLVSIYLFNRNLR